MRGFGSCKLQSLHCLTICVLLHPSLHSIIRYSRLGVDPGRASASEIMLTSEATDALRQSQIDKQFKGPLTVLRRPWCLHCWPRSLSYVHALSRDVVRRASDSRHEPCSFALSRTTLSRLSRRTRRTTPHDQAGMTPHDDRVVIASGLRRADASACASIRRPGLWVACYPLHPHPQRSIC